MKIGSDVIGSKIIITKNVQPIGFQTWKHYKQQEIETMKKLGVEKGIKPLVDAINKHSFMATVSSCEGHIERGEEFELAYVNFLVRRKDRLKLIKVFDQEVLAYKGIEIEDRTREFTLLDFFGAGFPSDALYMTIRIPIHDKVKKKALISLLVKKIRGIKKLER